MANYSANWISTPTMRNEGDSERMDWNAGYWNVPEEILRKLGPPPTPDAKPLIDAGGNIVGWNDASKEVGGAGAKQWTFDENGNLKDPFTTYAIPSPMSLGAKIALGLIGVTGGAAALGASGLLAANPASWSGLSWAGGGGAGAGGGAAGAASGGASSASGGGGGVLESILGQSVAPTAPAGVGGAAPGFYEAATGMSLASPGAFAGVLPETAATWGSGLTSAGTALANAGSSAATKTAGSSIAKTIADSLGISPTAAQLLGGLLGAGLGYADAKSQEGKTQGGAPAVSAVGMQYLNNAKPYERNTQYATQLQGLLGQRQTQDNPELKKAQQYVSGLLGAGYQPFRFY